MAHEVFISYSSKDKAAANAVCAKLESEGINCWMAPRDIPPSARYAQSIIGGINASRLMIFICSSHSNDSGHVESEIDRAYNKRIPIIPLRIEDVGLTASLEYYLSTAQWFDAVEPPLDSHLERLPKVVRQLLEHRSGAASAIDSTVPPPMATFRPPPKNPGFLSSTPLKVMLGLVFIVAVGAVIFLRLLPAFRQAEIRPAEASAVSSTNEMVTDARNGLMWTKKHNGVDINWNDASKYCDDLVLGGFDDWRLPSRLYLYATNDSDIAESDRIWNSMELEDKTCCYWAGNEQGAEHALAYNLRSDVQKLAKANTKEMRALCVHQTEK
jgi:hypothetical protein